MCDENFIIWHVFDCLVFLVSNEEWQWWFDDFFLNAKIGMVWFAQTSLRITWKPSFFLLFSLSFPPPFFSILLPSNSMAFHHFLLLPNPTSNSNPTSPNQDSSLNLPPRKCRCKWAFLLSVNLPIESTPQAFGSETTLFLIPFLSSSCSFPLPPFQLASSPSFLSAVLNPPLFPRFL